MRGALVLAGGKSQRMEKNKILTKLGNKPLLVHVIKQIHGITDEVTVVVGKNDELKKYTSILPSSVTVLKDKVEGKGPLMGILTGMQKMQSEYVVVLPCDSPFIKKKVLEHLFEKAQGADAVIPRWPNGNIEPLHAIYKISSTISATKATLKANELMILDMIKRLNKVIYLNTIDLRKFDQNLVTFFNINRQEDLRNATNLLNSKM